MFYLNFLFSDYLKLLMYFQINLTGQSTQSKTNLGGQQLEREKIESSDQGSDKEQPSPEPSSIRCHFYQHFCAKLISKLFCAFLRALF
jgi:hypothetical protein